MNNIAKRRRHSVPFSCGEEEKRREEMFYGKKNERDMHGTGLFISEEQRARYRKESDLIIVLHWYTNKYSLYDYQFACEIGLFAFRSLLSSYNEDYKFVINDYVTYHTIQETALLQHIFKEMKQWVFYKHGSLIEDSDDIIRLDFTVQKLK